MNYKATKKYVLILLFIMSSEPIFGAQEHDPLNALHWSFNQQARTVLTYIDIYTKCLEAHNFKHRNCNYRPELASSSQKLKALYDEVAQHSTPEQREAITADLKRLPFNILEPESPQHFEDVLMLKRQVRQYNAYALFKADQQERLQWRRRWDYCIEKENDQFIDRCKPLQEDIDKTEQEQSKLQAIFRQAAMADIITKHEPEFHAAHPELFPPKAELAPTQDQ